MTAFTVGTATTEWLRTRAERLRLHPGSDFQVRGVSDRDLNRLELDDIERELERRGEHPQLTDDQVFLRTQFRP